MYALEVKPNVNKILTKLAKKQPEKLRIIQKKLDFVRNNSNHSYKFLRQPLHTFNRVHVDDHFVLLFKINHLLKRVEVYHYAHHDKVYHWRPKD